MYNPIIIIGAPRSGTNMLRDLLVKLDSFETWPCDEINYIWRYGNKSYPSDEFVPSMATSEVKSFIRKKFDDLADKTHASYIVEKTCANSLRVDFVEEVIPDAKYIFIVRDGRDVIASAMHRWKAKLDIPYLLKKVRYVPFRDLPYYGLRYLKNRLEKIVSNEKRLSLWGPQLNELGQLLKSYTLEQVCAIQWKRCIENAESGFNNIDNDRLIRVKYEKFVSDPITEFKRICDFLDIDIEEEKVIELTRFISDKSVGKGRKELDFNELEIHKLISETLNDLEYTK